MSRLAVHTGIGSLSRAARLAGSVQAAFDEFLRRKGWTAVNAPLSLTYDATEAPANANTAAAE